MKEVLRLVQNQQREIMELRQELSSRRGETDKTQLSLQSQLNDMKRSLTTQVTGALNQHSYTESKGILISLWVVQHKYFPS